MDTLQRLTEVLQILAALGGWVVAIAFAPFVYSLYRQRDFSDRFWFSFGILIGWGGTGLNRVLAEVAKLMVARETPIPATLFQMILILSYIFMLVGMALHVRTVTGHEYGERFWAVCSLCMLILATMLAFAY